MAFRYISLTIFICFFSVAVSAEGLANKYEVDFVRVDKDGRGYVKFDSELIGAVPTCTQSQYSDALAFDTTEAGGKSILSLALTAKVSRQKIYAKGTGVCGNYGVMEDWSWGYAQ